MSDKSEAPDPTGPMKQVLPTEKTKDLKDDMAPVKTIAGKGLGSMGNSYSGKKP
jgi:hypothetical protein